MQYFNHNYYGSIKVFKTVFTMADMHRYSVLIHMCNDMCCVWYCRTAVYNRSWVVFTQFKSWSTSCGISFYQHSLFLQDHGKLKCCPLTWSTLWVALNVTYIFGWVLTIPYVEKNRDGWTILICVKSGQNKFIWQAKYGSRAQSNPYNLSVYSCHDY